LLAVARDASYVVITEDRATYGVSGAIMGNHETGRATFERIRRELESGQAHWVAREPEHAPYRLRAGRQYGADDDGEDEGDCGCDGCYEGAPRVCSSGK